MDNKKFIISLSTGILGTILINLGINIINKDRYLGIITALIGLSLLIFAYYVPQIKMNEDKIKTIEEWIENKEEILNTIKDIVILKKVSKIK